jgi:hypothetical protein
VLAAGTKASIKDMRPQAILFNFMDKPPLTTKRRQVNCCPLLQMMASCISPFENFAHGRHIYPEAGNKIKPMQALLLIFYVCSPG